jgi:hypothetical protein
MRCAATKFIHSFSLLIKNRTEHLHRPFATVDENFMILIITGNDARVQGNSVRRKH